MYSISWMPRLVVKAFGPLSVEWCDTPVRIPGSQASTMLAYLVLHRSRAHARSRLVGVFWPDLPESRANKRLRQNLWRIKNVFSTVSSCSPLHCTRTTVGIAPEVEVQCDLEDFERSILDAETSESSEDEVRLLERACGLAVGELLEGHYDEWILNSRSSARDQVIGALTRLVDIQVAAGDCGKALGAARRLVHLDPYEEGHHRAVMRALLDLGRRSEAAAQLSTCRRLVEVELGGELESETRALLA